MTDLLSAEALEQRANEQRQRLHDTVIELRSSVSERLDVEKMAQQHVWSISAGTGIVALILGYGIAGLFSD
jgi:hypothetical protein